MSRRFPFENLPHYLYMSRELAMNTSHQEYEFRLHRSNKTLIGSWVQPFYASGGDVHLSTAQETVTVRLYPGRYRSMVEIGDRLAVFFSLHSQTGEEWHRVPLLYDGENWLIEYRRRLP